MRPVAIFDSGIGGLTVMHEAMERLPDLPVIFYADQAHVPYGNKTPDMIRRYMHQVMADLAPYHVQALLLACNTATSAAAEDLRATADIPIIGMEPAVKPAVLQEAPGQKILVSATDLTLRLDKLNRLIDDLGAGERICRVSFQKLVQFAEQGDFDSPAVYRYLEDQLSPFNMREVGALVLGCTHFIYYKPVFKALLPPSVDVLDGNEGTVKRLQSLLTYDSVGEGGHASSRPIFLVSGKPANEQETMFFHRCLDRLKNC